VIKDLYNQHKHSIFVSIGVLALVAISIFYFSARNSSQPNGSGDAAPSQGEQEFNLSGDPISAFITLLTRQKQAKYRAVYDSTLEESSTSTVKRVILSVKQTDGKRKSDIWFNTAKVLSLIQNSDGTFACYFASDYKAPPCYKMSPSGALAEAIQEFSGGQLERLKAMVEKELLDIHAEKKVVSIGGEDRSCVLFTYSLKSDNASMADIRELFPIIGDVSDGDIVSAIKQLSLIKNSAHVCLDLASGVPLETEILFAVGTSTKHSTERATSFALDPVFNEQLTLEPLQRFDGPLFEYAFKKMFPHNDNLYVSASGIMRISNGAVVATSTGYGTFMDFIVHKGTLYAAAGKGIYRLTNNDAWEKMEKKESTFGNGFDMFKEVNGELYAQGEFTGVFRLDNNVWVEAGKFPKSLLTDALYEYDGELYARSELDGVFRLDGNTWTLFLDPTDFKGSTKMKIRSYHEKMYVVLGSSIYKMDNSKPVQLTSYKNYGSPNLYFERPGGGIYVGSDQGLFVVTDATTTQEATAKQVGEVNTIISFSGSLYLGTNRGVFVKDKGQWRQLSWPNDVGPINAFYVLNKNLYAAGALGLGKLVGNEWVTTPISLEDEKLNSNIEDAIELNGKVYVITKDEDDATLYVVKSVQGDGDEFGLPLNSTIIDVPVTK